MPYTVRIKTSAAKELAALEPKKLRVRVVELISTLANEPRPVGVKKIVGAEDAYRLRVGDYRIVYTVKDEIVLVEVVRVAHRREVYR